MKTIVEKWIPILRRRERYRAFNNSLTDINFYPLVLDQDETAFGVYENFSDQVGGSIVITDKGLHYCISNDQSNKLNFQDVLKTTFEGNVLTVEVLDIQLKNGTYFSIPIRRSEKNSRFTDLFEFMRFVDRVRDDLNSLHR